MLSIKTLVSQAEKKYLQILIILIALNPQYSVFAGQVYQPNIHYEAIESQKETTSKITKGKVIELFWYGCPHCNNLEPFINRWLHNKPENIKFERVPAIFYPGWEVYARAFYTAESLGILDRVHPAIFEAIHANKRNLNSEKAYSQFFKEMGVNETQFTKVFRSKKISENIRLARELTLRFGIREVPTLVVNGKYRTSRRLVQSNKELFDVTNYLLNVKR